MMANFWSKLSKITVDFFTQSQIIAGSAGLIFKIFTPMVDIKLQIINLT